MEKSRAVSDFLESLNTARSAAEFEKVCEEIIDARLAGTYQQFLDLFNRLVGKRNEILGKAGVFNHLARKAIKRVSDERMRVAPTPRDKYGITYPRLHRVG